ncbi:hypothetical protein KQI86_19200 [Clostridium sp. MSJ-11]|uniref:Uncharacterized protein n=1 Tax=Clostridium mobile TaxID=2841512 RepID=A0ABS6EP55_9CLOT|nr:hypothetical protein [Clostridium mobile]MBU5486431.1 hypothetical protein [Clostridium mobile]
MFNQLNNHISKMEKEGLKIYDNENPGFYIKSVKYNREKDKIEFECIEE